MAKDEDSLSEDDGVFSGSEGERLDYSVNDSDSSPEDSGEEEEAVATDEEEDGPKRKKKTSAPKGKKQKQKRSRFVEMEATVGDDDEDEDLGYYDEDDEEDDDDGFVDNEIEEREKGFAASFEKRLAAHAQRRAAAQKAFNEEMDPKAVEERLKQLYGKNSHHAGGKDMDTGALSGTALATMLQPQASDPKLWLVKCRPGKERAAVANLLRSLTVLGDGLGIFSVIGRDSLKGFIYVEAHKASDVMNAVQKTKLNHIIFASPVNKPVPVPVAEMADVLSSSMGGPAKTMADVSTSLKVGNWVRVKRGKYSGDLAQIVEVDEENTGETLQYIVRVKLIPRLSLRATSNNSNAKERPMARPFDPQEVSQYGSVTKARGFWIFNGEAYKDGYLFKDVRASSLLLGDVSPRPDELERFGALSLGDDASASDTTTHSQAVPMNFVKGERIVVTRGEFQHLQGHIDGKESNDLFMVRFDDNAAFKDAVPVPAKNLMRLLATGDMVRIIAGEQGGKSGMIVSLTGKQAVVFSTIDNQQYTIPFAHLTSKVDGEFHANPVSGGDSKKPLESFELHDLVSIENDEGEAGVIQRLLMEEKIATVLDVNGQVRRIPFKNLRKIVQNKITDKGAPADSSLFRTGDRVQFNVNNGSIPRPASVLHVFRNNAFLHCIDTGEMVVKQMAAVSRPTAFPGTVKSSDSDNRRQNRLPPMWHLVGKSVTISGAGPYKGYVGIVKDLTDTHARIELHTDSKVVTVGRERIAVPGAPGDANGSAPGMRGSRTPAWGIASGKTPAWTDTRTPAWGQSAKTPAWGASSAKTPAWGGQAAAKTPAWGASNSAKTPAWAASSSAKTPAWGASNSAKTPAWGASNSAKTPAWGASASSRTPAAGGFDGGKTPAWQSAINNTNSPAKNSTSNQVALAPWIIPDADVTSRSGSGICGRITAILPGGKVQLGGHNETMNASDLVPVAPAKKDSVRLLNDDRATGTVIGLDGPDAVIRVDGTSDFRIVPISSLVKIHR